MESNFTPAMSWLWSPGQEGPDDGGVVVAGDSGGFTRLGVTLSTFRAYRVAQGQVPPHSLDLREAPLGELTAIYHQWFWAAVGAPLLPGGVDLLVFDFGVTSGPGTAVRTLQGVVGTSPDGVMGPQTLGAAKTLSIAVLLPKFKTAVDQYDRSLSSYGEFGKGWDARRQRALVLAEKWTTPVQA